MNKRIALILLFTCLTKLFSQPGSTPQAEVKAVFLYNFSQFVEWPANLFSTPNEPFVIAILGENPFGPYLEETIRNEKMNGHPLVIKYFTQPEEMKGCHILFINKKNLSQLSQTLTALKNRSVLTVSDSPAFAQNGGMIQFFIENNKVKFEVNMEAVKDANLSISSKMLRLAQIVNLTKP